MTTIKARPTSPGRRFRVDVARTGLYEGPPVRSLVRRLSGTGGRNAHGRITVRHRGGGAKRLYRVIDFRRDKDGIPARVERLEYDPNRSAHIALLLYADGERRYIIAPQQLGVGDRILSGPQAPIRPGNALPLRNIPVGTLVHCVELQRGAGGKLARSAGSSAQLIARDGRYAVLRLRSGEQRRVHVECRAVIGEVSNPDHNLRSYGKAGVKRWLGIRPTVRGVAMNPVDHPHGGGEGRGKGNHPQSPWGQPAKGYKTRHNKRTDGMIVSRRRKK